MEPERKIEKLLRAFAKKRRDAAGDAFKLHPATRRILQGKVAQRAAKPGAVGWFGRLFGPLRPGLVYAVCLAVVVFIGAALLFPAFNQSKHRAQLASAKISHEPPDKAAPEYFAKQNQPLPGARVELQDSTGSIQFNFDAAQTRRELAPAPAAAPAVLPPASSVAADELKTIELPATTLALKRNNFKKGKMETDTADREKSAATEARATGGGAAFSGRDLAGEEVTIAPPLAAPAASAVVNRGSLAEPVATAAPAAQRLDGFAGPAEAVAGKSLARKDAVAKADTVTQQFAQSAGNPSNAQNVFKNAAASAKVTPVLANFQFQQNGSAVAVVDEDGSVYHGFLVAAKEAKLANQLADEKRAPTKLGAPAQKLAQDSVLNQNAVAPVENYFFRVAGTNRSLQQNVVFTGNMQTFSNVTRASSQTVGGGSLGRAGSVAPGLNQNVSQQKLFANARISGTAVVNNTNEIEIEALPVAP